jgi:hypothetical protein
MRRSIACVSVLLLAVAGCGRPRVPLVLHETASFPATPDKLVQLDLGNIDIEVTVAGSSTISVETDLEVRASSDAAARTWLAEHKPEILDSPSRLSIRRTSSRKGLYLAVFHESRSRIRVALPASCRLEVTTSSGDVRLSGVEPLQGSVKVTTSSGDLTVDGGAKALVVHTSSGDCRVDGPPLAALDLDSSTGDLRLRSGAAKLTVETSSGDVRADDLTGSLSFQSSSGDLLARWVGLVAGSGVNVETSSGDVTLHVPDGRWRGELTTSSGSLHCDLACTRQDHSCTLSGGDGATELRVTTTSGDIRVRTANLHDQTENHPATPGEPTPSPAPAEAETRPAAR